MSRLWPVAEAAQADYERLRAAVVSTGRLPDDVTSARFARRGLAGLIAWPDADPVFVAAIVGAQRPGWTPYGDPRVESLAAVFGLLMGRSGAGTTTAGRLHLAGSGS